MRTFEQYRSAITSHAVTRADWLRHELGEKGVQLSLQAVNAHLSLLERWAAGELPLADVFHAIPLPGVETGGLLYLAIRSHESGKEPARVTDPFGSHRPAWAREEYGARWTIRQEGERVLLDLDSPVLELRGVPFQFQEPRYSRPYWIHAGCIVVPA